MSFRSLALGLSLLAPFAALAGCTVPPDADEEAPVGVSQAAIRGGYDDPNDTAVVDITWVSGMYYSECTGSLIAPNLVLTARHCVAEINNSSGGVDCTVAKFGPTASPKDMGVSTKQIPNIYNPSDYHGVREVVVFNGANEVCGNDIAFLILKENIDPSEAVPLVPRVDSALETKSEYSAIGYGGTQDDGSGAGRRRRLDDLFVGCVAEKCPSLFVDKKEWQGDHGICHGDSGGPAIDTENRVIGITSRGGAGCTSPVYGYVYGWADLVKVVGNQAAEAGGYAPPMWAQGYSTDPKYSAPIGNDCQAGCASGICVTDAAGAYCTRECSDVGPCPDGFTCNVQPDGASICQKPQPAPSSTTPTQQKAGGCTISPDDTDPTKPVPWHIGAGLVALGTAVLRRRRGRATPSR